MKKTTGVMLTLASLIALSSTILGNANMMNGGTGHYAFINGEAIYPIKKDVKSVEVVESTAISEESLEDFRWFEEGDAPFWLFDNLITDRGNNKSETIVDQVKENINNKAELPKEELVDNSADAIQEQIDNVIVENIETQEEVKTWDPSMTTQDQEYLNGEIVINNGNGFELSEETKTGIMNAIKYSGTEMTFYITDPETNMTISYNATKPMPTASAIKIGMSLVACKMIDEGELNFDDKVQYTANDYCGGSGSIQFEAIGGYYTVRELLHRTINISDNIAYIMLARTVGTEKYNEYASKLGVENLMNPWNIWVDMSAEDLNLIWQDVYNSDREAGEELYQAIKNGEVVDEGKYSPCAILNYELLNAEFNFLNGAFPNYESSHKSGFNGKGYNDAGVIYTSHGNYVVSMMTKTTESASWIFNNLGAKLDSAIQEHGAYKESIAESEMAE